MRRLMTAVISAAVCFTVSLSAESLKHFDVRVEQQLHALDPRAVPVWRAANEARAQQKHEDAARLYAQVFSRVPSFVHALRRQAGEELEMGRRDLALQHGRTALDMERSSENMAMLAAALITFKDDSKPSKAELDEAKRLASEAARKNPGEAYPQNVLAAIAIESENLDMLRSATEKLEVIAPDEPGTHLYRMTIAASEGNWGDARSALERAKAAGLNGKAYLEMKHNLDAATPFYIRWFKPAAMAIAGWIGGFALLLGAGAVLSTIALRAARRTPQQMSGSAAGLSSGVRRAYSAVLTLSCLFYYASIPIVIILVLAAGGGIVYACFALGRIPVKLVIMVVVVAAVTVWSMIKSLLHRPEDVDPGTKLDLAKEPKLHALLQDVAKRIGTRPVDNVYLTPGTNVAVMERGKRKPKERCLILGLGALDGLKVRPLKAILGHEYGHFSNRDTAGGAFALSVRNSLGATAYGLATGGAAAWYNPAWLFVNGFNRVFLRISEGASRLQEVLADRWATFAYGADAFEAGLRHVIERSVRFDAHVGATLNEVVNRKAALANLYTYEPSTQADAKDIERDVAAALNRKASAYDSHPSPMERFALVHALPNRSRRLEPNDDDPAWSLFTHPVELQHLMTAQACANVRANYGVEIDVAPLA
jgi:Zn-dependent protease with chaperone function